MFRTGFVPGFVVVSVANAAQLKVRLLGPSDIALGDRVLGRSAWKGRKARTLLLILLNAAGYQIHREQLLDLLWPDLDLDAGNNALYKTLHSLRRTLEPDLARGRTSRYIETRGETIGITPGAPLWADVDQFHTLVAQAETSEPETRRRLLRRALDLHRGSYLADEPYADWAVARREALNTEREQAALTLAMLDREAGDPLVTVPYLEALLATDPTNEPIHRALMQTYAIGGQRELALRQFERCRETLDRELGEEPDPETRHLARAIRDQTPAEQTDLTPVTMTRGFLPTLPSRTVGREDEIDRLAALLLAPETRLVTVLGPGGVGKTRLATTAAHQVRDHCSDGAHFVSLAPVSDPALLFDAIATALRLHDIPTKTKQDLVIDHLQSRSMLLVLDNLEQLEDAATGIADLVEACPGVTVLATSRVPLRLRAERLLRLDPLALPDPTIDLQPRQGATELFWQLLEALDVTPHSAADTRSVAELCIQLDGLPLAIELAAARCSEHSPAAVLAQLQEHSRVALLRDGPRDLPARQQTLEDVVLWSYELLPLAEQALFRQLALFPGGIESDALQMLAGDDADALATALAEASLVQWSVVDGVRRITMLQTIRDVAHLLLEQAGEIPDLRERQGAFYREFAATAARGYEGVNQLEVMARFRRELPTLRSVLDWAASASPGLPLKIMTDSAPLWGNLGLVHEGHTRIGQTLEHLPPDPTLQRVLGTIVLGKFALWLARYDEARHWANHAQDLAAELRDPIGILKAGRLACQLLERDSAWDACVALNEDLLPLIQQNGSPNEMMEFHMSLSVALYYQSRQADARARLEDALAIARQTGNLLYASRILHNMVGVAHEQQDLAAMETLIEETERVATLVNNLEILAACDFNRSFLHGGRNECQEAAILALRASQRFQEIGAYRMMSAAHFSHAMHLTEAEAYQEAIAAFRTAIDSVDSMGHEHDIMSCIEEVGFLAIAIGRPADGLTLLAAFLAEFERLGEVMSDYEATRLQDKWGAARASLNPAEADAAEGTGRQMTLAEAVEAARTFCATSTVVDAAA